ncbi:unnamed protein product [Lactuca saligna]|uniref:Uncharacterized protein n=1 Tax=Lactuca saligna TaxID=75948 RepID=A0AA35Z8J3_LACSI|nr:unnamed protein product [Lactuca saligna]
MSIRFSSMFSTFALADGCFFGFDFIIGQHKKNQCSCWLFDCCLKCNADHPLRRAHNPSFSSPLSTAHCEGLLSQSLLGLDFEFIKHLPASCCKRDSVLSLRFFASYQILKPIVDAKSKLKRQWQLQGYKIEDIEIQFILNNQGL